MHFAMRNLCMSISNIIAGKPEENTDAFYIFNLYSFFAGFSIMLYIIFK